MSERLGIRFPGFDAEGPSPREQLAGTRMSDWVNATNIYDVLRLNALVRGSATALTYLANGDLSTAPRTWTHKAFQEDVARAANVLRRLGVVRGQAVGLLLPNLPEQQLLCWGSEAVAVAFPLNYLLDARHLAALLRAAKVRVLVAPGPAGHAEIWDKALALQAELQGQIEYVLQVDGPPVQRAGVVHWDALMADAQTSIADSALNGLEDIAAFFHTGGTTGEPKIVQQTHHNQLAAAFSGICLSETTHADVVANGNPMFHVAGALAVSLANFVRGGHMILLARTGFRERSIVLNFWRIVERYRVSVFAAVATAISAVAEVPVDGADISSLKHVSSGGAFVPRAVAERFEETSGVHLREVYGMTETSSLISAEARRSLRVHGSPGFAAPFLEVQIRVVQADGTVGGLVKQDEPGVVVVRGEMVTPGYLEPRHNDSAFTQDRWFITGDLGRLDAAGRLTLLGRSKDLIIRSGHNIDPQLIEEAAMAHPAVSAAAAVGRPDRYAGELPICYVVLRPGVEVSGAELLEFIAARVPERPANPKEVHVLQALPVTAVGKIFKPALRRDAVWRVAEAELLGVPYTALSVVDAPGGGILVRIGLSESADLARWRPHVAKRLDEFLFRWELVA